MRLVEFVKIFYGLSQCLLTQKENRPLLFNDDPGHNEVIVDMKSYEKDFQVFDLSTKTAKGIWLFARKDRKIEVTQRGIVQEGYSEDDLPWDMVNYKRVF